MGILALYPGNKQKIVDVSMLPKDIYAETGCPLFTVVLFPHRKTVKNYFKSFESNTCSLECVFDMETKTQSVTCSTL